MPVYKKRNKYYARINYIDSNGDYKQAQTKYFNSKKEAQIEEAKLLNSLAELKNKNTITFDEAFEEYCVYQKAKVKPQTYRKYNSLYAPIGKYLGKIKIEDLTTVQYQNFKNEVNKLDLCTSSKNRFHKLVKSIIRYTDMMHGISSNVPNRLGGFTDPNEKKKEMLFFTYDEFLKFIDVFKDDIVYRVFFKTLYYMGLRVGEANALTWNDIDFEKETINVNKTVTSKIKEYKHKISVDGRDYEVPYFISSPKTKNSNRILPCEKEVLRELKALHEYYSGFYAFSSDWFVFGGIRPLSETQFTKLKDKACEQAEVKRIRIHDFRHSCASLYINNGAQPILIQKLLGHAKLSITLDTYSHMYPSIIEEAVKSIENFKENYKKS